MTSLYEIATTYRADAAPVARPRPTAEVVTDTLDAVAGELEVKAQNVVMFARDLQLPPPPSRTQRNRWQAPQGYREPGETPSGVRAGMHATADLKTNAPFSARHPGETSERWDVRNPAKAYCRGIHERQSHHRHTRQDRDCRRDQGRARKCRARLVQCTPLAIS